MRALLALRWRGAAASDAEVITLGSGVGVRLFRPAGVTEPAPALLWIHGGGYVIGNAKKDDRLCRRFSKRLGITVASVEYRLAPEHPYPAPLEDCYSALTWLAGLPAVDPARVAIGGASAGGGLAAALALLARDRAEVTPMFQFLVYPMLDDRSSLTADKPNYRLWNPRSNRFGWTAYLGDADPQVAVPARRDDLERTAARMDRRRHATTCSTTRTSPTPSACKPPACPATSRWSPASSTASTCGRRKPSVTTVFRQSVR